MEQKPLHQIEKLKTEIEQLKLRCSFLENERKSDASTITELKFEVVKLQGENRQLQREKLALRESNNGFEYLDMVDLDSDDDENEREVSMLIELPPHTRTTRHNQIPTSPSEILSCKDCNFQTHHKPSFKRHRNAHNMPTLECPQPGCSYHTTSNKRIWNHVSKVHKMQREEMELNFRQQTETE